MTLADIVDLQRYPIDRPESPELAAVIADARTRLADNGCAVIKGFVRPEAVAAMAAESQALRNQGKHSEKEVTAYPPFLLSDRAGWPQDHPRAWHKTRRNRFVTYDLIGQDSPLRRLYESRAMTDLVRRCIGKERLYLYGDPLGACTLSLQTEGEELPWHFDVTHFVVSLLVQKPEAGGDFQYVPHIKSAEDENYEGVAEALNGGSSRAITLDLQPGDLQLFEGRYSIHRVTAPVGPVSRSIALLSYCERPGEICEESMQLLQYGRAERRPLIRENAAAGEMT